jgi:Hydrolytic ATP binding site of dynein motor region
MLLIIYFQDVPLFQGIISDLFPGVELPQVDLGVFLDALTDQIVKHKLQPVPWFISKIVQVQQLKYFHCNLTNYHSSAIFKIKSITL